MVRDPDTIAWGRTYAPLRPRVEEILQTARADTDVVVLDIDATVLRNADDVEPCRGVVVEAGRHIYDRAQDLGLEVHLVTARLARPDVRRFTERQLHCLGYPDFSSLAMRPPRVRSGPAISAYKRRARRGIANRTSKSVVLNVGDQWFDLVRYHDAERRASLEAATSHMPFVLFSNRDDEPRVRWHLKLPAEA